MSKLVHCYTCNVQHPVEEMRQVETKRGMRWRCIKTIVAARRARDKRQEFGALTTAKNSADARARLRRLINPELDANS